MPPLTTMARPGKAAFIRTHEVVVERRDLAVLLRAQALEPGLAGVDGDPPHPGLGHQGEEGGEHALGVLVVDADPALDGHRHRAGGVDHRRGRSRRRSSGRAHQRGAEAAGLHAVGRAADVEVDLVVAVVAADRRGGGERRGLGAAELQRERLLLRAEAEQPVPRRRGARRRW